MTYVSYPSFVLSENLALELLPTVLWGEDFFHQGPRWLKTYRKAIFVRFVVCITMSNFDQIASLLA